MLLLSAQVSFLSDVYTAFPETNMKKHFNFKKSVLDKLSIPGDSDWYSRPYIFFILRKKYSKPYIFVNRL
jgi:hypothetical protein